MAFISIRCVWADHSRSINIIAPPNTIAYRCSLRKRAKAFAIVFVLTDAAKHMMNVTEMSNCERFDLHI